MAKTMGEQENQDREDGKPWAIVAVELRRRDNWVAMVSVFDDGSERVVANYPTDAAAINAMVSKLTQLGISPEFIGEQLSRGITVGQDGEAQKEG